MTFIEHVLIFILTKKKLFLQSLKNNNNIPIKVKGKYIVLDTQIKDLQQNVMLYINKALMLSMTI